MAVELLLLVVAALLLLSILASKAAGWLGVPSLLLFLLLGMLAGSEGIGGIAFDDAGLAQAIGVISLALILFAGGLETDWNVVKPTLRSGLSLATLGVAVTAVLVGFFAHAFLNFGLLEGLLLGAILSSTDAAAVFAVLRGRSVHLRGKLEPLLELEAGSNDPMAVFLTIALTGLVAQPDQPILALVIFFFQQLILGVAGGSLIGLLSLWLLNRLRLEYDGLYPVLTLALALLIYGVTAALGGSGFLAVYLAGLLLGNRDFIHKKSLTRFHDGVAWLMQITMFLSLGLLVAPSRLIPMAGMGLIIALFLMLVARPFSALLALLFSRFSLRERLMVGWVACAAPPQSSWRLSRSWRACPRRIRSSTWSFSPSSPRCCCKARPSCRLRAHWASRRPRRAARPPRRCPSKRRSSRSSCRPTQPPSGGNCWTSACPAGCWSC